jgi:hypothetical protein
MLRQIEDDLTIFVQLVASLSGTKKEEFESKFDAEYKKLHALSDKTIKNHRTEMIKLFGLVIHNDDGIVEPSARTMNLITTQNFQLFFKTFCNRFQFPNCINKPQETIEQMKHGVSFKPAAFILEMLREAEAISGKTLRVSGPEISNVVFNDTRVTSGIVMPRQVAEQMISLRSEQHTFDGGSRMAQHGREFLGYMYLAGLLNVEENGSFSLNHNESRSSSFIIDRKKSIFFDVPQDYISNADVRKKTAREWEMWYGEVSSIEILRLEPSTETIEEFKDTAAKEVGMTAADVATEPWIISRRDVGSVGEHVVLKYEKETIKRKRPDKAELVRIVSNDTSLGYDIQSIDLEDFSRKKLIEVKTTIRTFMPDSEIITFFPMSSNEWETARHNGDNYYIYRVFLTRESAKIFVIRNPVKEYGEGNIVVEPLSYRVLVKSEAGDYLSEIKMR